MGLQFVLGRPGSGKSQYVYRQAVDGSLQSPQKGSYVFVVPEQATFQTQQTLLALHPHHAIHNIDVTGFTRLAYHVFLETGFQPPVILDDVGKNMILRRVAQGVADSLQLYGAALDKNGFIDEIKSLISEFKQYKITPETIDGVCSGANCPAMLKAKLHDVAVIMEAFERSLGTEYITAEEILHCLAGQLAADGRLAEQTFVFDGFTGFTPIQYDVISQLLLYAKEVVVVLTARELADVETGTSEQDLFHMSRTVWRRLHTAARENGVRIRQPVVIDGNPHGRFAHCAALDRLERQFSNPGRYSDGGAIAEEAAGAVRVLSYTNREKEAEGIAVEIRRLILQGYHYRDIGVIAAGELDSYAPVLRRQMEKAGLPYFIDEKRGMMDNPLVRLLRFVLEVFEENYSYASVIAYLRCGLSDVSREQTDELENYVLAAGKRGAAQWHSVWKSRPNGMSEEALARVNAARAAFCAETDGLRAALGTEDGNVRTRIGALYAYLRQIRAEEKLDALREALLQRGETLLARQYEQIYGKIIELFDTYVGLMGEEVLSRRLFAEILECGLMKMKVGLVPPALDRLVVGDIRRTRFGNIRVLFIIGLNEGVFPAAVRKTGILTEAERRRLQQGGGMELAPDGREDIFIQEYYCYLAMTRPSERLYCSYILTDAEGKAAKRSFYLDRLLEQLPFVRETRGDVFFTADNISAPEHDIVFLRESVPALLDGGAAPETEEKREKPSPEQALLYSALYAWYAQSGQYDNVLQAVRGGMLSAYREDMLLAATARVLYGAGALNSVTRLERFAACEFSHFLTYGLRAKERALHRIEAKDMGTVYHAVMEKLYAEMNRKNLSWRDMDEQPELRSRLIHALLEAELADEAMEIFTESGRNRELVRRAEALLNTAVRVIAAQMRLGTFETAGAEMTFGVAEAVPPIELRLENGIVMRIQGKIDRIDVSKTGTETNARAADGGAGAGETENLRLYYNVIDYKSGGTRFDETKLAEGLQLQLVLYMQAARAYLRQKYPNAELTPGGIYYFHLDNPYVEGAVTDSEEETFRRIMQEMRLNGVMNQSMDYFDRMEQPPRAKTSQVIQSVQYGKDGLGARTACAHSAEQIEGLGELCSQKAQELGARIFEGHTLVNPYQYGQETPCAYCAYRSVCGFDTALPGYRYRRLQKRRCETLWDSDGPKSSGQRSH